MNRWGNRVGAEVRAHAQSMILVLQASQVRLVTYGLVLHLLHEILAYRVSLGLGVVRDGLEARRWMLLHGGLHRIRKAF